jgi:catechol 2,3-dioxygenase-like lactoylglutathione lyase family enzyme
MITVKDIVYVRYQAPDLDVMEQFLIDFGLFRAHRTATTLYMRSRGPMPYVHVTDLGPDRSVGYGLIAHSVADLETLAAECGSTVEQNPEPAGGKMVRIVDPSGYQITVLADVREVEPMPMRALFDGNRASQRTRFGKTTRVATQPSHVHRLGHVALRVADFEGTYGFLTGKLGFRVSDSGYAGTKDNVVGHFLRCGLGKEYTDHHTIAIFKRPESKIDHSAFEVLDWDDLMVGNKHLLAKGYNHQWGVGRHVEGSQIFDYWRDPFGNKIEHWTDGDLVNEDYVGKVSKLSPEGLAQWGPPLPADFYK